MNENGLRRRDQAQLIANLELPVASPVRWRLVWALHDHLALYRNQFLLRELLQRPWSVRWKSGEAPATVAARPWTLASTPHVFEAERDHLFGVSARRELSAIAARARERGVACVLANLPLPEEYSGYWADGAASYRRYLDALSEVAREHGLPLIDLNDASFRREEFQDSHHLAPAGAVRASVLLGERLRGLKLLDPGN